MVFATLILTAVFICYVYGWPWGRRWAFRFALPVAVLANASAMAVGGLVILLAESGLLVDGRLGTYIEWNRAFVFLPLAGLLNLLALAQPAGPYLRSAAWMANGALALYAGWYWIRHESFEGFGGTPPFGADLITALAVISLMTLAWDNGPVSAGGSAVFCPAKEGAFAERKTTLHWRGMFVVGLAAAMILVWLPALLTVLRRSGLEYAVTSLGGEISDRSARIAPLRIRELAPLRPYVTEIEAVYIPKNVLTPNSCESFAVAIGNLPRIYEVNAMELPEGCGALLHHLPFNSRLEHVILTGPGVTDETLADLARCKRLTIASFAGSRISDDGLRHLSGLVWLRNLVLRGAPLSGSGLTYLASLTGLTSLDLAKTYVGDEQISELAKFSSLISLDLRGTRVTVEGLQRLQRAVPRCQLDWEPAK
jgi:hypothetical protein